MKIPIAIVLGLSIAAADIPIFATETNSLEVPAALGWQVAHQKDLNGIKINASELTNFLSGFALGAADRHLPLDMRVISPDIDALAKIRQQPVLDAIKKRSARAAQDYFTHWKQTARVEPLPDGVLFEIMQHGDGTFPKPTQTARVHYVARLVDGSVISEFGPDDIILATNHLNVGLFEGLLKLDRGGAMKLYLPPALAAHEIEMAGASPGSALVYEIELLGVRATSTNNLADALVPPAPEPAPPGYSGKFATNDVIEAWGWEIAQRTRLWKLSLNEQELDALTRGFELGVRNEPAPPALNAAKPQVRQFIRERMRQYELAFQQKQIAAMNALFARLDRDTNVVKLPDGLRYQILRPGNGIFPKPGQTVLVNYTAQTLDGHIFDKTVNEPLHVQVGRVIPGWNEGIQKISKGGRIKLYIPPSLGYGSDAVSGIPADSTLIYEIDLLDITDVNGS